jgi:DNA-binding transcriptional regulator YiaG
MTPSELKQFRADWELSTSGLAQLLGLKDARTIRKWEAGENDISGPALLLMELYGLHPVVRKFLETRAKEA